MTSVQEGMTRKNESYTPEEASDSIKSWSWVVS